MRQREKDGGGLSAKFIDNKLSMASMPAVVSAFDDNTFFFSLFAQMFS